MANNNWYSRYSGTMNDAFKKVGDKVTQGADVLRNSNQVISNMPTANLNPFSSANSTPAPVTPTVKSPDPKRPNNLTDVGDMYYQNTKRDLTRVNPNVVSARASDQRTASANQYAATLRAREAAAAQGFQPGTAQASRLQQEAISPVLQANVAQRAATDAEQRKYYDEAMNRAQGIETDEQAKANVKFNQEDLKQMRIWERADVEWTNRNTEIVRDQTSAQQYLNNISDPVTKAWMASRYADGGLEGLRASMVDYKNAPKMSTPQELVVQGITAAVNSLTANPDGSGKWGSTQKQAEINKRINQLDALMIAPITEGAKVVDSKTAIQNLSTKLQNDPNTVPTGEEIKAAYPTQLTDASLAQYNGGADRTWQDLARKYESTNGWFNLKGQPAQIVGGKKAGQSGRYWLQVKTGDGVAWYNGALNLWQTNDPAISLSEPKESFWETINPFRGY